MISEPIPNGFFSVVPEPTLKDLFDVIPTLDELLLMDFDSVRPDIILVDAEKDENLSMLKKLTAARVKDLNVSVSSDPAAMVEEIARLVFDFYKSPNLDLSPGKPFEENSHASKNKGVQMLGEIKHGSYRPRAILFKVLADTVGLESRLMEDLPIEGASKAVDSYKHMYVSVLNSVEHLVDLMPCPGKPIPLSTKAISAAGEFDSAENDSFVSLLEPNSPLHGVSERVDPEIQFGSFTQTVEELLREQEVPQFAEIETLDEVPIQRGVVILPNVIAADFKRFEWKERWCYPRCNQPHFECKRAHFKADFVVGPHPEILENYKLKMCDASSDKKFCVYGPRCWFAHTPVETNVHIRHTVACPLFKRIGACYFSDIGKACVFSHEGMAAYAAEEDDDDGGGPWIRVQRRRRGRY